MTSTSNPKLVHIDVETSGLDPQDNSLLEVAWAVEDGPINYGKIITYNGLKESGYYIDPKAMEINKFEEREPAIPMLNYGQLEDDLRGNILVGMNISFDESFLRQILAPVWFYRKIDIESYAMGKLDLDKVPSSRDIARILVDRFNIGLEVYSDHTAYNDVAAQREIFEELQQL